jgi:hypothetical protein
LKNAPTHMRTPAHLYNIQWLEKHVDDPFIYFPVNITHDENRDRREMVP